MKDQLIFEKSVAGRSALSLMKNELTEQYRPASEIARKEAAKLPEVAEVTLVRHYMELSNKVFGVDNGFYPLGSCTMKYNPKVNEKLAALPGFTNIHPLQAEKTVQGALQVIFELQNALSEIAGMDETTLLPAAGAHGEWTGLALIRAYHLSRGDDKRKKILVPDSAHGTNPASASMCGFSVVSIPSNEEGYVDIEALKAAADGEVAALMLTNPNTLGMFEKNILEMSQIVHDAGGLLYCDGANMNAVMGVTRPGDMGFDVLHWNVHKTLSAPHGGGGPGCGPVGCKAFLAPFMPVPRVKKGEEGFRLVSDYPDAMGNIRLFYGNFLVALKGYCYVLAMGGKGLKEASQNAVLNANYLLRHLQKYSSKQYADPCMHEFVLSMEGLAHKTGVKAMDVAKKMIDYGVHPPTMYFPLIVHEALMFEPTETESRETLDYLIQVFEEIMKLAEEDPEALHSAPRSTPVGRLDEVGAARSPVLRYEI